MHVVLSRTACCHAYLGPVTSSWCAMLVCTPQKRAVCGAQSMVPYTEAPLHKTGHWPTQITWQRNLGSKCEWSRHKSQATCPSFLQLKEEQSRFTSQCCPSLTARHALRSSSTMHLWRLPSSTMSCRHSCSRRRWSSPPTTACRQARCLPDFVLQAAAAKDSCLKLSLDRNGLPNGHSIAAAAATRSQLHGCASAAASLRSPPRAKGCRSSLHGPSAEPLFPPAWCTGWVWRLGAWAAQPGLNYARDKESCARLFATWRPCTDWDARHALIGFLSLIRHASVMAVCEVCSWTQSLHWLGLEDCLV